jgi:hypothetical protein
MLTWSIVEAETVAWGFHALGKRTTTQYECILYWWVYWQRTITLKYIVYQCTEISLERQYQKSGQTYCTVPWNQDPLEKQAIHWCLFCLFGFILSGKTWQYILELLFSRNHLGRKLWWTDGAARPTQRITILCSNDSKTDLLAVLHSTLVMYVWP